MDTLSLLMFRGMDPRAVRDMVARQTQRRVRMFTRVVDLIFGFVMYFWGGLTFTAADGHALSDEELKTLNTEQKLNALLSGMKTTDKSTRFREFFRPLLIDAAEFIANMMEPDELMLSLVTGGPVGGGAWVPANPGAPAGGTWVPPSLPPAAPAYTSALPVAPATDPTQMPGTERNPIKVKRGQEY